MSTTAQQARHPQAMTLNDVGEWVPAIAEPARVVRWRCWCGKKYWTRAGYRGHYALAHILHLDDR